MNKGFDFESIVEGIRDRNELQEQRRLVDKWTGSGLLRGLKGQNRFTMARMLENQAVQYLRESASLSTGAGAVTSSGQVQGFTTNVFPMVRRIFANLVAKELVSVQALSLPSGLIFYIDFVYGSNSGGNAGLGLSSSATYMTYQKGQSIFSNPAGRGLQSGSLAAGGQYDLMGTGYSKVHSGSATLSGSNANIGAWTGAAEAWSASGSVKALTDFSGTNARFLNFDPTLETDISNNTYDVTFVHVAVTALQAVLPNIDLRAVDQIGLFGFTAANNATTWSASYQGGSGLYNLRRLNKRGTWTGTVFTPDPLNGDHVQFVVKLSNAGTVPTMTTTANPVSAAVADSISVESTTGAVTTIPSFETDFGSSPTPAIPEIDFKIESITITTQSRKLRARWTPELAQDVNAYHALDAESELTNVLTTHVGVEIDREILFELLSMGNGASLYWSRAPGKFVNSTTGAAQTLASSLSIGPAFTGSVQEWYQTLVETISNVANTIYRKTLRGQANFVVCSPDVATILEHTVAYKPKLSVDGEGQVAAPFMVGVENVGTLSNRYTVYKDPVFPINRILVGYKGGSYLETGYVYSPYIPLIMSQTIFGQDDFTPRKMLMTRYGKKMIRSDFYGSVTVLDMNII